MSAELLFYPRLGHVQQILPFHGRWESLTVHVRHGGYCVSFKKQIIYGMDTISCSALLYMLGHADVQTGGKEAVSPVEGR